VLPEASFMFPRIGAVCATCWLRLRAGPGGCFCFAFLVVALVFPSIVFALPWWHCLKRNKQRMQSGITSRGGFMHICRQWALSP
jgi:hypothetical protein